MKLIVHGHTTVTVHVEIDVDEEKYRKKEISEEEIYALAASRFSGIVAYCGNGGLDKIIGVTGIGNSISADESVEFDDYQEK